MGVIMYQNFHRTLERLDGSVKAKAWDFVTKLSGDTERTGLDLKIPQGAVDTRVRTARVDHSFRAVVFAVGTDPEPMWLLAGIHPHDEAYREAATLRLDVNAANGAIELLRTAAIEQTVSAFRNRPLSTDGPLILPFTVAELVGIGIDPAIAEQAVRLTDDDRIFELVRDLPLWQQQVLVDLATGVSIEDVRLAYELHRVTDDDPQRAVQRPISRMEFVLLADDDELRRMIEGDFAAWRTYLHPTQRAVAHRSHNGPFRLAGGAGTGKTVVAIHRAAHLAGRPAARVLLCTFTRNLANGLHLDLRTVLSPDQVDRVDVRGVDQIVRAVVSAVDGPPGQLVSALEQGRLWADAVRDARVPEDLAARLTPEFLGAEYRAVVLALPHHTRAAYLGARRTGRGTRLTRVQRAAVWAVIDAFEQTVRRQGRFTFDILAARAADIVASDPRHPGLPRYDHVIVDEGQDLHAAHWRMLRGLVDEGADDLFICEDGHQRIYGERVVLGHLGIATRGRSRRLTLNYRTTRQNLRLALGVIGDEPIADLDGDDETVAGYRSLLSGPEPSLRGFASAVEETAFVCETVRDWATRIGPAQIAVLCHHRDDVERVRAALYDIGLPVEVLDKGNPAAPAAVKVASMHRAKGTEFRRVVVIGACDGSLPAEHAMRGLVGSELAAALARERSLFYVACSRAREELVVTWSGRPSRFLPTRTPDQRHPAAH